LLLILHMPLHKLLLQVHAATQMQQLHQRNREGTQGRQDWAFSFTMPPLLSRMASWLERDEDLQLQCLKLKHRSSLPR
jgi:hypothetical protein